VQAGIVSWGIGNEKIQMMLNCLMNDCDYIQLPSK
jgi:hypothetical protein